MTIDRYRVGWAASMKMRKEGVDQYLTSHRKQAKPMINVDVVVLVGCMMVASFVAGLLMGLNDREDCKPTIKQSSTYSTVTKCTSYDIRDGHKYFLTWRRV